MTLFSLEKVETTIALIDSSRLIFSLVETHSSRSLGLSMICYTRWLNLIKTLIVAISNFLLHDVLRCWLAFMNLREETHVARNSRSSIPRLS